jgi:hypothetical protein
VVDLNKFSPGSELQPGLLTIIEQMPGLVMAADLTEVRSQLLWVLLYTLGSGAVIAHTSVACWYS